MSSSKRPAALLALGFSSYTEYLRSDLWRAFRARYKASGLPRRCRVCQAKKIQLHHVSYARVGAERLDDVEPLCRRHHRQVHRELKKRKLVLEQSFKVIAALRQRWDARKKKK